MHEMSYVVKIVNMAIEKAVEQYATKVLSVTIEVGEMTGLESVYLKKYYETATKDTILEGSKLIVIPTRVFAVCASCREQYHPCRENDYICPKCRNGTASLASGREFNIRNIKIET